MTFSSSPDISLYREHLSVVECCWVSIYAEKKLVSMRKCRTVRPKGPPSSFLEQVDLSISLPEGQGDKQSHLREEWT